MTSAEGIPPTHEYELGHSDWELERLRRQAKLVDPFTLQFYRDAGITKGMKVLDVGCGAGDTALLLAELVGDDGLVVGVDREPAALQAAGKRIRALGKRNISFRLTRLDSVEEGEPFDAVVGRYVLMYNPDPPGVLRALATQVKRRGIIAFHEADWSGCHSKPSAPLYDRCCDLIVETFKRVGAHRYMERDLYLTFVRAGLAPVMDLRALIGGAAGDLGIVDLIAELGIAIAPVMEAYGLIGPDEIDAPFYQERMREEVRRLCSVMVGRFEIGAWSRLP
jgi:SAM-dependent methyltransferase